MSRTTKVDPRSEQQCTCDHSASDVITDQYCPVHGSLRHSEPRGQQQEWTQETIMLLWDEVAKNSKLRFKDFCQSVADKANKELAAEREERAIIERSRDAWKSQVTGLTEALAAERQGREKLEKVARAWEDDTKRYAQNSDHYRQQLMSVLAAIEKVDFDADLVVGALDSLGLALANHEHTWTNGEHAIYEQSLKVLWNMSEQIRALKSADLSALHKHDAEVRSKADKDWREQVAELITEYEQELAEVREPLVEALEQLRCYTGVTGNMLIDDALVKVKEVKCSS